MLRGFSLPTFYNHVTPSRGGRETQSSSFTTNSQASAKRGSSSLYGRVLKAQSTAEQVASWEAAVSGVYCGKVVMQRSRCPLEALSPEWHSSQGRRVPGSLPRRQSTIALMVLGGRSVGSRILLFLKSLSNCRARIEVLASVVKAVDANSLLIVSVRVRSVVRCAVCHSGFPLVVVIQIESDIWAASIACRTWV